MDELRHLQLVVMNIAKDVDKLCRENNIHYYLGGGGAIGAVRHHGFIPWDDDLDFLMPYEEYERFVKICKEKLDLNKYEIDQDLNNWAIPMLKIRLKGTYIEEKEKSIEEGKCQGIFLDVFRLEHSPESNFWKHIQYYASKLWIAYNCKYIGYKTDDIQKMLDENRYCGDVLTQLAAVESALQSVGYIILQEHMRTCMSEEIKQGSTEVVDETLELIKKLK